MKYNIIAYLLAFRGQLEAEDEAAAEARVRQLCNYPSTAPMIIKFAEEVEETDVS